MDGTVRVVAYCGGWCLNKLCQPKLECLWIVVGPYLTRSLHKPSPLFLCVFVRIHREHLMPTTFIFADEAGCFTFNRNPNVSRYFILCTIITKTLDVGHRLHDLRHDLIWKQARVGDYFHATSDEQTVRNEVFNRILMSDFTIQATICEKSKAQPQITQSKARFYKYPWFYHFSHGITKNIATPNRLLVTAASLGTKKERESFKNALGDVMHQTMGNTQWGVDFRPSQADPSLQVADYCAWAIQRKWELGDDRSYRLIAGRITYEYELWRHGSKHYY